MSDPLPFTLAIPREMATDDRDALLVALRPVAKLEPTVNRGPHELMEILRVILQHSGDIQVSLQHAADLAKPVGAMADAGTKVMAFVAAVGVWRQGRHQHGHTPQGRLERAGQPSLELATASDQQVLDWLLNIPAKP